MMRGRVFPQFNHCADGIARLSQLSHGHLVGRYFFVCFYFFWNIAKPFSVLSGARWQCFRDVVLIVNVSEVQVEFETVFSGKMEELSVSSEHEDTGY